MATANPTGDGDPVRLKFRSHHADFLRRTLTAFKEGAEGDLAGEAELADRQRIERDVAAYERLLTALDTESIVVHKDVIAVASSLLETTDTANAYQRATRQHRACCSLLMQLTEGSGR